MLISLLPLERQMNNVNCPYKVMISLHENCSLRCFMCKQTLDAQELHIQSTYLLAFCSITLYKKPETLPLRLHILLMKALSSMDVLLNDWHRTRGRNTHSIELSLHWWIFFPSFFLPSFHSFFFFLSLAELLLHCPYLHFYFSICFEL